MEAKIKRDDCIGCGACADTCPEVFRMAADGLAEVYGAITPDNAASAQEAMDNCPVSAITIE